MSLDNADKDKTASGALGRGLRVLVALNDLQTSTITGLVAETGLPKPTLIRLLHTLVELGFAAHDTQTGTYNVTPKVASLSRGLIDRGLRDGRVKDVLDGLADELKWPIELLFQEGGSMVVNTNNRDRAPIKLALFERRRFGLLQSAAGLIVLAQMAPEERDRLIDRFARSAEEAQQTHAAAALAQERGYGHRMLAELADHMAVASVAIPGVTGALSLVYFEDVLPREAFEAKVLKPLLAGAAAVAEALNQPQ